MTPPAPFWMAPGSWSSWPSSSAPLAFGSRRRGEKKRRSGGNGSRAPAAPAPPVHALVISVASRPNRLEHFRQRMRASGPSSLSSWISTWRVVDAVTPDKERPEVREAIRQSHLKALKLARDEGWERVVVFEDDVDFAKNAELKWRRLVAALPDDFDVVYLGASSISDPARFSLVAAASTTTRPPLLRLRQGHVTGAFAVLYSRKALDAAIGALEANERSADRHADILVSAAMARRGGESSSSSSSSRVFVAAPFVCTVMPLEKSTQRAQVLPDEDGKMDLWDYVFPAEIAALSLRHGLAAARQPFLLGRACARRCRCVRCNRARLALAGDHRRMPRA